MKAIKITLWILGVLVVLVVGGVIAVINLVDPNEFKPRISVMVEQATGRKLTLEGDIELSFYPWIGVRTGAMDLSDREGFGAEPMLSLSEADIRLKLLPLLRRELEIGEVLINEPMLRLTTLENGENNWSDLLGEGTSGSGGQNETAAVAALAVQGVSIADGNVAWDDRSTGEMLTVRDLNLNTGMIVPGVPLDVQTSGKVQSNSVPDEIPLSLETTVSIDDAMEAIKLSETTFSTVFEGQDLVSEMSEVIYQADKDTVTIPALSLAIGGLGLTGDLAVSGLSTSLAANGNIALQSPDLTASVEALGLDVIPDQYPPGKTDLGLAFNFMNDAVELNRIVGNIDIAGIRTDLDIPFVSILLEDMSSEIPGFTVKQGSTVIAGKVNTGPLSVGPEINGEVRVEIPDVPTFVAALPGELEVMGSYLGLTMPDGIVPESINLGLGFAVSDDNIVLTNLDSEVAGSVNLSVSSPRVSLDMASGNLEVPEFLVRQNDATVRGDISADELFGSSEAMRLVGNASIDTGNLNAFLANNGLEEILPPELFESVTLSTGFEYENDKLALSDLNADIDQVLANENAGSVNLSVSSPRVSLDMASGNLEVPEFLVRQNGALVGGGVSANGLFGPIEEMRLVGNTSIDADDLNAFLANNGLEEMLPPDMFKSLSISTRFEYANDKLALSDLEADLEQVPVKGSAGPVTVSVSSPSVDLDIESGNLEIAEFKIRQNDASVKGGVSANALFGPSEEMRLVGTASIDAGNLNAFLANNGLEEMLPPGLFNSLALSTRFDIENGNLALSDMTADLDQTRAVGSVGMNNLLTDSDPDVSVVQTITDINLGNVLSSLEIYDDLEGAGEVQLDISNILSGADRPLAEIEGSIAFRATDGEIRGFDLQRTLLAINDALKAAGSSLAREEYEADASTRFTELSGSFSGSGGVLYANDINIKSPGLRIDGTGNLDLQNEKVDLLFEVNVVASVDGQGGAPLEDLKGLRIPLTVAGPIDAPSYGLDIKGLLEAEAKRELKKEVEKKLQEELEKELQKELEEQAEKELKDQLKDDLEKEAKKKLGDELLKLLGE